MIPRFLEKPRNCKNEISLNMPETEFEKGMFAEVAVLISVTHTLIYSVPDYFTDTIKLGIVVFVPFGKKNITGYITSYCKDAPEGVKPLLDIVSLKTFVSDKTS